MSSVPVVFMQFALISVILFQLIVKKIVKD